MFVRDKVHLSLPGTIQHVGREGCEINRIYMDNIIEKVALVLMKTPATHLILQQYS